MVALSHRITEAKLLAAGRSFASMSAAIDGLAHTLLVQLVRWPGAARRPLSFYALYREGGMTFEVTTRISPAAPEALDNLLAGLLRSDEFSLSIVRPLAREVDLHFGRRPGSGPAHG